MPELPPVEASVFWVERDDEVVGAGFPCPCILRLDGLDEWQPSSTSWAVVTTARLAARNQVARGAWLWPRM